MSELAELLKISHYAGKRFDLVQAGGGNSSIKLDNGLMLIKASGISLSEMTVESGIAEVNIQLVRDILQDKVLQAIQNKRDREQISLAKLLKTVTRPKELPSIESFLHAFTDKVTLHTHPILCNALSCRKDGKKLLEELFPETLVLEYCTPGYENAVQYLKSLTEFELKHSKKPAVTFIQNHGLVVSGKTAEEVIQLNEHILSIIAEYLEVELDFYLSESYSMSNLRVSSPELFSFSPVFPAQAESENLTSPNEEILFAHALTLKLGGLVNMNPLSQDELDYLRNWAVDGYRANSV
ncbi:MAG: class II aldolase/adducin family protein [Bacteroidetes bacterium]|nr:class II aldolase/adducin family protein [Bacteroidota bacterium]